MRVHYKTFGCKANQYDTERMRQALEAVGGSAAQLDAADLCVVNTCTVTSQADADARRYVRRAKRTNPSVRVVVAGCSAALQEDRYRAMPGVGDVVRGHDPEAVVAASLGLLGGSRGPLTQLGSTESLDRADVEPIALTVLHRRAGATRGWLKVQDGCDRHCSFCATRLARGKSRSRAPEDIVHEAGMLAQTHPELVVTGIHIGHYGRDLDPKWTLSRLVAELLDRVPDVRLRLGSIEATEIDDDMIRLLESSGGRLTPHLHMPLQSGADPVLKAMRRWHTADMYRSRALEVAARVHPLGLGADIITGFPGETDADHDQTRRMVEELPYTYLHVFPYSPREGTAAASLDRLVPQRVAGERSRELRELAQRKGAAYATSRVGDVAEVVLEGEGGTGLTEDYLRVSVASAAPPRGLHRGRLATGPSGLRIDLSPDAQLN